MKYKIKQPVLSSAQIYEVNDSDTPPSYYLDYLSTTNKPSTANLNKAWYLYQTVGFIDASNPNDAFMKGNVWEGFEDDVFHVGQGMRSISVGDVLIDEIGLGYAVSNSGFLQFQPPNQKEPKEAIA